MPETLSIGLGGGSEVHMSDDGHVSVGPISVGHRLLERSRCFGGSILTATDIVVASDGESAVSGTVSKLQSLDKTLITNARENIRKQLENGIDIMKTSDLPVALLLVGGGSIILQDPPRNVQHCIQPEFSDVANAVGAAIAKISGDIDIIVMPGNKTDVDILGDISAQATNIAVSNGAHPDTVDIVELDLIPIQYSANGGVRAIAKAVSLFRSEIPLCSCCIAAKRFI
jgi:N-methylhydantoinase A/oxoprolinase/acetone carboxylase beta subunit